MNYFKNTLKFTIKHPALAAPLFVCTVAYNMTGYPDLFEQILSIITISIANHEYLLNYDVITNSGIGIGLAFTLQVSTMPLLYGLVNKGVSTGSVSLKDSLSVIRANLPGYIRYCAGYLLLSIPIIALVTLLKWMSIKMVSAESAPVINQLTGQGLSWLSVILALYAVILLSLWFAAMVADNKNVFEGMKISLGIASSFFGTLLIVFILLIIFQVGSLSIFGYFGLFDGNYRFTFMLTGLVSVIKDFILVTFLLTLYYGETGRKFFKSLPASN